MTDEAAQVEYESVKAEVDRLAHQRIRWCATHPGVENADLNYKLEAAYKKLLKAAARLEEK